MESHKLQVKSLETLGVLYLASPLLLFYAAFIRVEIAIPACLLTLHQLYILCRHTCWRKIRELLSWETTFVVCISTTLLLWLYGVGPLSANGDWYKHYAVVNFLAQHHWPPEAPVDGIGRATLRYYVGWYLVPAAIVKLVHAPVQYGAVVAWSALGLSIFFKILISMIGKTRSAIAAPLIFIMFGGADIIGVLLENGHFAQSGEVQWWAGWIEYNSPLVGIAWAPQHTLSAWLGIALLMKYRDCVFFLPFHFLVGVAVAFWSPFSAIGLAPFLCAIAARHGLKRLALSWLPLLSVALLAIPVGIYLTSSPERVPHGFIGSLPCVISGLPCFSARNYVLFVVIEIGVPLGILLLWREKKTEGFLVVAAMTLCLIPFYKVGEDNDFAIRVSAPALAILGILCAKRFAEGTKAQTATILAVVLMALPKNVIELARPIYSKEHVTPDVTFPAYIPAEMLPQYLVAPPLWILRS